MNHLQFIGLHKGAFVAQDTYQTNLEHFDPSHEVRIIHIKDPYLYVEPLHYHDALEFIYCINGPISVKINNHQINLNSNELLSVPYLMSHQISYNHDNQFIKCNISGRYMVKNLPSYPNFMKENISKSPFYEPLLHELTECITGLSQLEQLGFTSSLNMFLYIVQKNLPPYYDNNESWQDNAPEKFMDILLHIHANFNTDLNVTDITTKFSISQQYLSRKFRQFMNMTFNEYLTMLRLDHATYLLRNTKLSIHEVLLQSGYSTKQNFAVAFKNKYSCTPTEYRKKKKSI